MEVKTEDDKPTGKDTETANGTAPPVPGLVAPPPPPPPSLLPIPAPTATSSPPGGPNAEATAAATALSGSGKAVVAAAAGGDAKGETAENRGTAEGGFDALLAGPTSSDILLPPDLAAAAQPGTAASGAAASVPADPKAPAQPVAPPVPLGAVPMTIGLRALAGSSRFEISLDPKDLGRIDVNLDIDKDRGTVTAHLVVDRPETLALLQRDASSLQQALSQAGLDTGGNGIQLSLRSETGSGGRGGEDRPSGGGQRGSASAESADPRMTLNTPPFRALRGLGGIDIRI